MKTMQNTEENKLKQSLYIQKIQLYKQKLQKKGEALLEYYNQFPKLSEQERKQLDETYIVYTTKHKERNKNVRVEAYEDFFALEKSYRGRRAEDSYVRTAYIYNYYVLSCFLYLNKKVHLPWNINVYWEEIDITNPIYKDYSIDSLVEKTKLDYIEIHIEKPKTKRKKRSN